MYVDNNRKKKKFVEMENQRCNIKKSNYIKCHKLKILEMQYYSRTQTQNGK